MVYIKCLNVPKSKMFFLVSSLNDSDSVKLVDLLHDNHVKLKAVSQEEVEDINPYLEEITDCYYLPKGSLDEKYILEILAEKGYAGKKIQKIQSAE